MFGARFRLSRHFLVESVPGRPGTPKQVVREGYTLRLRLERAGYLDTMPHPACFLVLKGSREGVRDGAPSAASFAA